MNCYFEFVLAGIVFVIDLRLFGHLFSPSLAGLIVVSVSADRPVSIPSNCDKQLLAVDDHGKANDG
jgi:hypothetical protein